MPGRAGQRALRGETGGKHAKRWGLLGSAVLLALGAAIAPAAAQTGGGTTPQATEIGVTPTTIRIAVVADVNNAAAPGIFQGSVDAVNGFAKYVNAHGGIAGRKVVVDFYDSKLSDSEARNAVIKACSNDFAMVGTSALFLNNVDDQLACKDQAGAPTGLPDLPFVTTEVVQQCSPDTYPMAPPQIICSTQGDHPQTYQSNVGRGYYYKQKFGNSLHGVYIFGNDVKAAENSTIASLGQLRQVCCTSDQDFGVSAASPQSAYTPIVQTMKNHNSNYGQSTSTFNTTVSLRREAQLQGVMAKVWDCGTQCYSPQILTQGGSAVDGEYVDTLYLPFLDSAERAANPMAAAFVKYTGADKAGELGGVYAWSAGVALQQAINAAVKQGGVNAVTRKNIFTQLKAIHSFNAAGLLGTIDLAGRVISPCHVLLQIQNGKFVRLSPTKPGTFDCAKKNVIHEKLDLSSS